MRDQERDMTAAEAVVYAQLTLRAVVWDAAQTEDGETDRLENEMKLFHIIKTIKADTVKEEAKSECKADTMKKEVECKADAVKKEADYREVYDKITGYLQRAGILEEQALLVTEDGRLSDYVYGLRQDDGRGMAVVYYERDGSRRDVSADMTVQGFEETGVQFLDRIHKRRNRLPWNILYTERTCVREITLSDLDELYALYEGKGITDYTEPLFERPEEEEYTKSYIACMYYYYGYGMWIIRDRYTGSLIGRAGIDHHEEGNGVLMELGYIIGTEYQNKGYATEVCTAVIEYAKEELGIEELHCFIHRMNQASLRVARKLGFTQCDSFCEQKDMLHFIKNIHN